GFIYDGPRIMTPEEQVIREAQRQQARENARRRAEEKRQRSRQKRAAAEAAAREFEEAYRPFLNVIRRIVDKLEARFIAMCQSCIRHRAWSPDLTFYEFPVKGSAEEEAERWSHELLTGGEEGAQELGVETMAYMECLIEILAADCSRHLARPQKRSARRMRPGRRTATPVRAVRVRHCRCRTSAGKLIATLVAKNKVLHLGFNSTRTKAVWRGRKGNLQSLVKRRLLHKTRNKQLRRTK